MRFLFTASAAALLLFGAAQADASALNPVSATTVATVTQAAQPPDINVQIEDSDDGVVWFANPVWVAIGVLAIVVLGLVIGMAARGSGGTGSTIVK
jgi:hypothetical protein